jgi:uncharacterized membrane protein YhfC
VDILFINHFLNGFLMVALPVGLALYLTYQWKMSGRIWWIGAVTFILSQVGHIPFNWGIGKFLNQTRMVSWNPTNRLVFNAVFLGLSAGIFEEVTRYLVIRFWAKDICSWRKGILLGVGHSGAEAIIYGALALNAFLHLAAVRNTDLSKLFSAGQVIVAQQQVRAYWSMKWYDSMLGALERFFAIPCGIAMAVIVIQVFTRKEIRWLFLAIGYHALLDALSVLNLKYLGVYWTEAVVGGFAILSVILIYLLRQQPEPFAENTPSVNTPAVIIPEPVEETSENLENTRFQ